VDDEFRYTPDTWDMLASRAIDWQDVDYVLRHAHPVSRRWMGDTTLRITALDRNSRWLMITSIEVEGLDNVFEIYDARYLDDTEGGKN